MVPRNCPSASPAGTKAWRRNQARPTSSLRPKRSNPFARLRRYGLLRRLACHRAGPRGPDPLAPRNDELSVRAADHRHQFRDLLALVGLVAAGNGVLDAMRHVIAQHLLLDAPKRGP